jgi:hypothetical protein
MDEVRRHAEDFARKRVAQQPVVFFSVFSAMNAGLSCMVSLKTIQRRVRSMPSLVRRAEYREKANRLP